MDESVKMCIESGFMKDNGDGSLSLSQRGGVVAVSWALGYRLEVPENKQMARQLDDSPDLARVVAAYFIGSEADSLRTSLQAKAAIKKELEKIDQGEKEDL